MADVLDFPPPYEAIAFDCDSTLSAIEGIDELGREFGSLVFKLTDQAMSGEIPLGEVYGRRLELVKPSKAAVQAVGELYVERVLPNVRELIAALHSLEKRVYIVSGGVLPAVKVLAAHLEVPAARVFAVDLFHDENGEYTGFEEANPLAANDGKAAVVRSLEEENIALVGDGVSDLEAVDVVRRFIAFGGVEPRESVFSRSRVTCSSPDFAALLPLLCTGEEIETLANDPRHAGLVHSANEHVTSIHPKS